MRRGLFIVGVNRYFSLIMYGYGSNNTLYSASLPFVMFIFLLTPFDTRDSHYFRSNVSLVLLINIVGTPPPPYPKIESLGGGRYDCFC